MNLESLIQETAKKVIANMKETPAGSAGQTPITPAIRSSNLVIILDGADEGLDHGLQQVNAMTMAGVRGQIILTSSVDPARVQLSGLEVIPSAASMTLAHDGVVYIPYLSVGLAGKIANLLEDEAALKVITRGLIGQNKVFIGISELDLFINGKKRLSFGISQRLKEYQRLIKAYDLIMIKDVNQVIKECSSTALPMQGGVSAGVKGSPSSATSATCSCGTSGCDGCGQCVVLNKTGVTNVIENGANRISSAPGAAAHSQELAGMIDHTLLKPNATEEEVRKLCEEARKFNFASVCVNPSYVATASAALAGSSARVCTVIGFPLGATTSTTKAMETRDAIANGATEIDMVINVGALKSGNNALVKKDIEAVVEAARGRAIVKVILETSLLTDEEKVRACLLSKYAGADFVKTATGFGPGGATVEDIALMRKTVGAEMGVKASGGIRDLQTAQAMIAAGATRIGASASVAIVKGAADSGKGY